MKRIIIFILISLILVTSVIALDVKVNGERSISFDKSDSTTYYPTSYLTLVGTESGGNNLGNLSYYDNELFIINEGAGSGIEFYVNFTGLGTSVNNLLLREQYDGGLNTVMIEIWDYDSSSWESYGSINAQGSQTPFIIPISDSDEHIDGGVLQLRFVQDSGGNPSYSFEIDYIQLLKGTTAQINNEHDALAGRNNECTNHPWVCALTNALSSAIDSINSSLPNYLQNIVEDITPQLGGDLDAQDNDIDNVNFLNATTIYMTYIKGGDIPFNANQPYRYAVNSSNTYSQTTTYIPTAMSINNVNSGGVANNVAVLRSGVSSNNGANNALSELNTIQPTINSHEADFSIKLRRDNGAYREVFYVDNSQSKINFRDFNLQFDSANRIAWTGFFSDPVIYSDGIDLFIYPDDFIGGNVYTGFLYGDYGNFGNFQVDNININGNAITSNTGTISTGNDNIDTTGYIKGNTYYVGSGTIHQIFSNGGYLNFIADELSVLKLGSDSVTLGDYDGDSTGATIELDIDNEITTINADLDVNGDIEGNKVTIGNYYFYPNATNSSLHLYNLSGDHASLGVHDIFYFSHNESTDNPLETFTSGYEYSECEELVNVTDISRPVYVEYQEEQCDYNHVEYCEDVKKCEMVLGSDGIYQQECNNETVCEILPEREIVTDYRYYPIYNNISLEVSIYDDTICYDEEQTDCVILYHNETRTYQNKSDIIGYGRKEIETYKIKEELSNCSNITKIKTTYPYTKVQKQKSSGCTQANIQGALADLNKNINLYENLTDFDTGIMSENYYTQSKVINASDNYALRFLNVTQLANKFTHKNYEKLEDVNIPEDKRDVLNMENRIVDLEGAFSDHMTCMYLHTKYEDYRDCMLDTNPKEKIK